MPIKQDSGTSLGAFSKFPDEHPRHFYRGVPPPPPRKFYWGGPPPPPSQGLAGECSSILAAEPCEDWEQVKSRLL